MKVGGKLIILGIEINVAQEQQAIHTGEAFEIWQHLVMRYDTQELTDIFQNYANDIELKAMLMGKQTRTLLLNGLIKMY